MLDNLKLGYGGTQEEMKRLIKEAANMKDAQRELGITVDKNSMSFANIVDAISVVQYSMGIAGATAQEAEHTISGSINAMKAAWQNLVTAFADPEQDLGTYVNRFVESVITVKDNIVPRIREMLPRIVEGLGQLIDELGPIARELVTELLPHLIQGAANLVADLIVRLPGILVDFAIALKDALLRSLDDAGYGEIADKIESVFQWIENNKDAVVAALVAIGGALAAAFAVGTIANFAAAISGLMNPVTLLVVAIGAAAALIVTYWDEISAAVSFVVNGLAQEIEELKAELAEDWAEIENFISRAIDSVNAAFYNMGVAFGNLVNNIGAWVSKMLSSIGSWAKEMAQKATQAGREFTQNLLNALNQLVSSVTSVGTRIVNNIKNGIASAWSSLASWFNSLWNNLFGSRSVSVGVSYSSSSRRNGSHAGGLDYVPFNGYIAELHRGETVLTASEAKEYRNGKNKSVSPIFNITVNGTKYDDLGKLARDLMYEMQSEYQKWEFAHA